jgi:hypothetical protein
LPSVFNEPLDCFTDSFSAQFIGFSLCGFPYFLAKSGAVVIAIGIAVQFHVFSSFRSAADIRPVSSANSLHISIREDMELSVIVAGRLVFVCRYTFLDAFVINPLAPLSGFISE